jgi:putative membrane protein
MSESSKARTDSRVRDELANERTFLAWLRTAANVMIVGLGIAKFGGGGKITVWSFTSGALLVVVGAVGAVYGSVRYRRTSSELEAGVVWPVDRTKGPVLAAGVLVIACVLALALLVMGE